MRRKILVLLMLTIFYALLTGNTFAAELNKLEDRVIALEKITDNDIKVSGYIQAYYGWFEGSSNKDTFDLRRGFLTLDGKSDKNIDYRVQVDVVADTKILRDAWVKYNGFSFFTIKVGQFKIPFSHEQLTGSSSLYTIERSKVATILSYAYDIGILLEGNTGNSKVAYAAALVNGTGSNTADTNDNKDFVGRIVMEPFKADDTTVLKNLSLGCYFQTGRQAIIGNNEGSRKSFGSLLMYTYDNFKIISEYIYQDMEQIDRKSIYSDGWYIMGIDSFNPRFQGVVEFEEYDPNRKAGEDKEYVVTLGINWFAVENVKIQANYRIKTEQASIDNNEFLLQTQVKF